MLIPFPHKFMIVGSARTGTTQLATICNAHPMLKKCYYEPFLHMKHYKYPRDEDWIRDHGDQFIRDRLYTLYNSGDGIKELTTCNYYNTWFRKHIFALPIKIILTERKNILRQAISMYIASESKIWNQGNMSGVDYLDYLEIVASLRNFPCDIIKRHIINIIKTYQSVKKELDVISKPYFHLIYEDYFFGHSDVQEQITKDMFEFIGVESIFNKRMRMLLDYGRLNSEEVYRNIQNLDEIEKRFSEYGYLIDRTLL